MPYSPVPVGNQFIRNFPVPLDRDFVFATTAARTSYLTDSATSGIAYSGMIVADLQTNKVYVLNSSMAWQEVGITVNETFGASNSGMLFKTGNNTFTVGGLNSGSNIGITNASGLAGNPTISLNSSVTGLNNLTSISGIFSNTLAVSGSLTLNGKNITSDIEAVKNTNTANFNNYIGYMTSVGTNGGPSYYGTYDQGGNAKEYFTLSTESSNFVGIRGGNFNTYVETSCGSEDALCKSRRSAAITPQGPYVAIGFRLASRYNVDKQYQLVFTANNSGIATFNNSSHNFELNDPISFINVDGSLALPSGLGTGVYYIKATGLSTFSVSSGVGTAAIVPTSTGTNITSCSIYTNYGSFVGVTGSNSADSTNYGAVSYDYRIGKYEITNDEYSEFLNAIARDDEYTNPDGSNYALYNPWMETEEPYNGIARSSSYPTYIYNSLQSKNKRPVVIVSWRSAARYANWLHNGKPTAQRYRSVLISYSTTPTTVYLPSHGYVAGDEIMFDCAVGSSFSGTLTKQEKFIVGGANLSTNYFEVKNTSGGDVSFLTSGQFYVRKYFVKSSAINYGAYTMGSDETVAPAKLSTARYWIPTENEWYKAAYYDPNKNSLGSGYWNYPTRSDTLPTPIEVDSEGNGAYGFQIPSHTHSSYDVIDFTNRVGGLFIDGSGTEPVFDIANSTIKVNVTGIPLSTVTDVTASSTEVNYLDLSTGAGTAEASKALVLNSNKAISGINNLTAGTGIFTSGSFAASLSADSASTLMVGGTGVSLSGHKHYYTPGVGFNDIPNFCSGVADCLDTSLSASTGIIFNYSSNAVNVSLSGQALALHNLSSNGIIVRSGIGVVTSRTITSGVNINVTNGDGVSGNPTIALSASVSGLSDLTVDQIKIDGSTISTTGNNDSITLAPNGTGEVNIDRVDIDGGFIDGTTIGSGTAASGNFTVVTVDNTKIDNNKIYLSNVARIDLDTSETVINSLGSGINFRVAGSGNTATNLLFVDSTNNRVGIGTNSPSSLFSVSGAVNFNSTITAPNIGDTTSSNSLVTLDGGSFKARTVDSRVWGPTFTLVDGDGNGSAGRIPYWSDSNSLTQSSNLFWDSGNSRLGIGTTSPLMSLDVRGDAGVSGNLTVGGNITVTGTTFIANVDMLRIKDPIILLGSGTTDADINNDRGLSLALSASVTGFLGWSTSGNEFIALSSGVAGSSSGTYSPGTYGAFRAGTINSTGSFNGRVLNVTGTLNTAAGANNGQINLYGSNGNFISWNTSGQGAPTTSVRSSGTKLVLYPDLATGNVDTAIGTDNGGQTLWHSIKTGSQASFKWYIGSAEKANLDGNGNFATSGTITSNGAGGFTGNGASITGVNAYGLNVYSNSLTDTVTSLVMVTGTGTGNLRPFIDSGLKFNANTNSLILENISGTLSTIFNSTTYNSVFSATSISGLAAFGSNNESYLLNFIIDGGTP